jgi:hypothetical protein
MFWYNSLWYKLRILSNLTKSLALEGLVALAGVEHHLRKAQASKGGTYAQYKHACVLLLL